MPYGILQIRWSKKWPTRLISIKQTWWVFFPTKARCGTFLSRRKEFFFPNSIEYIIIFFDIFCKILAIFLYMFVKHALARDNFFWKKICSLSWMPWSLWKGTWGPEKKTHRHQKWGNFSGFYSIPSNVKYFILF